MLTYVNQFLTALIFSAVVEGLVILALCLWLKKDKRIAWVAVFGTMCTIPYVWFVFPTIFWYSATTSIIVGESFAFVLETGFYKTIGKLSWRHALAFSLTANAASFVLGKFLLS